MDEGEARTRVAASQLTLYVSKSGDHFFWVYDPELLDTARVQQAINNFTIFLQGAVTEPDFPLRHLPLLTMAEQRLLTAWNSTRTEFPRGQCIHELFEACAARTPEHVAAIFHDEQLTYRELNERANRLAHYLGRRQIGPNVLVGIAMDRSLDMLVGLLGILKAGGAYVPLDPEYPPARLKFMLEDNVRR